MMRGAVFSPCGRYRYRLWRIWDLVLPTIGWCLKNPSTASADEEDPTSRRVIDYSQRWGGGSCLIVNPVAWVETDPRKVPEAERTLVQVENLYHLVYANRVCEYVVGGWGAGTPERLCAGMREVFGPKLRYLDLTKSGEPKHPLYLSAELLPKPFC